MGLILHCGVDSQSREEIAHLTYPAPMGSRHIVRPFIDSIDLVTDQLKLKGFQITDEAFGIKMGKDGTAAQLFGAIEVRQQPHPVLEGECIPAGSSEDRSVVGIRASTDQTLPFGLVAGSRVVVCDNLCFSGDLVKVSTKQSTFINDRIEGLVSNAIALLPQEIERENKRFDAYKNYALTGVKGDALLIELVRQGILNVCDLPTAIKEWDTPTYVEHAAQGNTVWKLFNACTQAFKSRGKANRTTLPTAWNRGLPLIEFFDEGVGLVH